MKTKIILFITFINFLFLLGCTSVSRDTTSNTKLEKYSKLDVYPRTEEEVKKYLDSNFDKLDPIEGIWSISYEDKSQRGQSLLRQNVCRCAIIKSNYVNGQEFIEITYYDQNNNFQNKEITAYFISTAYEKKYTSTQLSPDGSSTNANFLIDENGCLTSTIEIYENYVKYYHTWYYTKMFPKYKKELQKKSLDSTSSELKGTGSGFLISSNGLIVTNHHVVVDGARIEIVFPGKGLTKKAKVKMKDIQNDIAILEIENFTFSDISLNEIPFSFAENSSVKVGQDVFTLGFPLGDIMGTSPRLASGTINSLYGINDDPRLYQVNNAIQPGNSGGALFNRKGELVGICVSGLNAKFFYENAGIIPQNMNFAIKGSYLKNIIGMMAEGDEILKRANIVKQSTLEEQIEQLNPFIVQIRVY